MLKNYFCYVRNKIPETITIMLEKENFIRQLILYFNFDQL